MNIAIQHLESELKRIQSAIDVARKCQKSLEQQAADTRVEADLLEAKYLELRQVTVMAREAGKKPALEVTPAVSPETALAAQAATAPAVPTSVETQKEAGKGKRA